MILSFPYTFFLLLWYIKYCFGGWTTMYSDSFGSATTTQSYWATTFDASSGATQDCGGANGGTWGLKLADATSGCPRSWYTNWFDPVISGDVLYKISFYYRAGSNSDEDCEMPDNGEDVTVTFDRNGVTDTVITTLTNTVTSFTLFTSYQYSSVDFRLYFYQPTCSMVNGDAYVVDVMLISYCNSEPIGDDCLDSYTVNGYDGYTTNGYYYFHDDSTIYDFYSARSLCKTIHPAAELFIPSDSTLNEQMYDTINSDSWIGVYNMYEEAGDDQGTNHYYFINSGAEGGTISYSNWGSTPSYDYNCAYMSSLDDEWYELDCSSTTKSVTCQLLLTDESESYSSNGYENVIYQEDGDGPDYCDFDTLPNCPDYYKKCNGFIYTEDSVVCDGKGDCEFNSTSKLPNCVCDDEVNSSTGENCDEYICFGTHSVDEEDSVCRGEGDCTEVDTCQCYANFTGSECQYCNRSYCYDHGDCSRLSTSPWNTTCSCDSGYTGDRCQYLTCSSVLFNDTNVCRQKGECIGPNDCNCSTHYSGDECQYCNRSYCSSQGECSESSESPWVESCDCDSGYTGEICQYLTCFSVLFNDTNVCRQKGDCVGPNTCTCYANYSGSNCEVCETSFCNHHGNCNQEDSSPWTESCACDSGYTGDQCEYLTCFLVLYNDTNVCRQKGDCLGPNVCQCYTNYSGSNCEVCETSFCNHHGNCTQEDSSPWSENCVCISGYTGDQCEYLTCFLVLYNDTNVCRQKGDCIGPNECNCSTHYSGDECQYCNRSFCNDQGDCSRNSESPWSESCSCDSGYTGEICQYLTCSSVLFNDSNVCRQKGDCVGPNNCSCFANYTGENCEVCETSYCNNHGTCTQEDSSPWTESCACISGYTGDQCEYLTCFLVLYNDTNVCRSKGECTGPNECNCSTHYFGDDCQYCNRSFCNDQGDCSRNSESPWSESCSCDSGYTGEICQYLTCSSVLFNDTNVCRRKGECIGPNECNCSTHYSGDECQYCTRSYCSSQGECSRNSEFPWSESCDCDSGYTGEICQYLTCFSVLYNDTNVCRQKGDCVGPNTCTCHANYSGSNCEVCETSFCNHHGNCTQEDSSPWTESCACDSGYTGDQCEYLICFLVLYNDTNVCRQKGDCIGPNECNCSEHYSGDECQYCNRSYCSSQGECSESSESPWVESCDCDSGYTGEICQYLTCFSVLFNDTNVCRQKGDCVGPNVCQCYANYSGSNCEVCETSFCDNHGNCSQGLASPWPPSCSCYSGYSGDQCQYLTCSSVLFNDTNVCQRKGECIGPNDCNCSLHYFGDDCQYCNRSYCNDQGECSQSSESPWVVSCDCDSGYTGEICQYLTCFSVLYNDTNVCRQKGNCVGPNNCSCFANYTGENCEVCETSFCNHHGNCTQEDNSPWTESCACDSGYTGGQCEYLTCFLVLYNDTNVCRQKGDCLGPNVCQCFSNFSGDECQYCNRSYCYDHGDCSESSTSPWIPTCSCESGYTGDRCEYLTCSSVLYNDSFVCRQKGDCIGPNACQCYANFTGSECQYCNRSYCYDHGDCSRLSTSPWNTTCSCDSGYTGDRCEFLTCFSVLFNDTNVCRQKGDCIGPNECDCFTNFTGENCEYCERSYCEGKGNCSQDLSSPWPPNCVCDDDFYGLTCTEHDCFGVHYLDEEVCSGRGVCGSPNNCSCMNTENNIYGDNCELCTRFFCSYHGNCSQVANTSYPWNSLECSCDDSYYGTTCEYFDCYDIPYYEENNVCRGRGNCTSPDTCECDSGYTLPDCKSENCVNDNNFCSGHGTCDINEDACDCEDGYYGYTCEFYFCNNVIYNDSTSVCEGHGTCVSPERCLCEADYSGNTNNSCDLWNCFGVRNDNRSHVCFGNGSCDSHDNCTCEEFFYGNECQSCSRDLCSNNGNCSRSEDLTSYPYENIICSCDDGYTKSKCDQFECFDLDHDDVDVCRQKGDCVGTNICSCFANYSGSNCEVCETSFCDNHGNCSQGLSSPWPPSCSCYSGYSGDQCQYLICFELLFNDTNVCRRKGECIGPNECNCSMHYSGDVCQYCNRSYCNDQGDCSRNSESPWVESCDCDLGYTGEICQYLTCFSVLYNDTNVCRQKGDCIGPNYCQCNANYSGSNCEVCETSFCNHHGACTQEDNSPWTESCACDSGYTGDKCEYLTCFLVLYNDTNVCRQKGDCIGPNVCQCSANFSGDECQYCNRSYCYDHGDCSESSTSPWIPTCSCESGYTGDRCQYLTCSSVLFNDTNVCRRKGECIGPNDCNCSTHYSGDECQYCNRSYCSSQGECSRNSEYPWSESCDCDSGYTGEICQYLTCFSVLYNDTNVCRQKGDCVGPNNCSCFANYTGENCELCKTSFCNHHGTCTQEDSSPWTESCACESGYTGDQCEYLTCFLVLYNDTNVCRQKGDCIGPNVCQCFSNFSGDECQYCNRSYCYDHGECVQDDFFPWISRCSCEEGYTKSRCNESECFYYDHDDYINVCRKKGSCVSPNTCICDPNYFGDECEFCNITECFGHGNCSRSLLYPWSTKCDCYSGYEGVSCEIIQCYNYTTNDSEVCGSFGECISPDICSCPPTHNGLECQYPLCFGIPSNEKSFVCTARGECMGVDMCSCYDEYFGDECNLTTCFGISSNEYDAVCSSNGNCVDVDLCECNKYNEIPLFGGETCDIPMCDGVLITDNDLLCSQQGTCDPVTHICECYEGWKGSSCQFDEMSMCFGYWQTDVENVCSGHGDCLFPDFCNCTDERYGGERCNVEKCYGIEKTDLENVCSANGTCTDFECICTGLYGGLECELPMCNGIVSTDSEVCSGHGNCAEPNTCECDTGYGGVDGYCSTFICFGKLSDKEEVCTNHGDCIGPDECSCDEGYSRDDCSLPWCFGEEAEVLNGTTEYILNPLACSGHGECVLKDYCLCFQDDNGDYIYKGEDCSEFYCDGILSSETGVCSGHGDCIAKSTCECEPEYSGDICSEYDCYNTSQGDPDVCSGKGECTTADYCNCNEGYSGDECSDFSCSGFHYTDELNVCSGHGDCVEPNSCECEENYISIGLEECSRWDCFEIQAVSIFACGGHGTCYEYNECECEPLWEGEECDVPECFGISALTEGDLEEELCSGHGDCYQPDTCVCEEEYDDGKDCSECSPQYKGENCELKHCDEEVTCFSHGICDTETLECVCDTNFGEPFCSGCEENYFYSEVDDQCNIFCESSLNCSGSGECTSIGCLCFDSDEEGHFISSTMTSVQQVECDLCTSEWYGSSCNVFISSNFTFSDEYDRIFGTFMDPTRTISSVDCSVLVHSDDLDSKIGELALCYWSNDDVDESTISEEFDLHRFEIVLGSGPELIPGDVINININHGEDIAFYDKTVLEGNENFVVEEVDGTKYFQVKVNPPLNPIPPIAVLNSESEVGGCDPITLDGSKSVTYDGKMMTFSYEIVEGCNMTTIQKFLDNTTLQNSNKMKVIIPQEILLSGCIYQFALIVHSSFGLVSDSSVVQVNKKDEDVPMARINGELNRNFLFTNSIFSIEGSAIECGNVQNPEGYYFNWEPLSDISKTLTYELANSNQRIVFRRADWTVISMEEYTFQFSVSPITNSSYVSTKTVTFTTIPMDLVALIDGGDREVSNSTLVVVDGSSSYDPNLDDEVNTDGIVYTWTCKDLHSLETCSLSGGSSEILEISSGSFQAGIYEIKLEINSGVRTSSASIQLTYHDVELPIVRIGAIPSVINANTMMILYGFAVGIDGIPMYSGELQWRVNDVIPSEALVFTPSDQSVLGVRANSLLPGSKYVFKLTFSYEDEESHSMRNVSSSVATKINTPPKPGVFTVEPEEGFEFTTIFTFRCSFWTDDHVPLIYTYYYIDPVTEQEVLLLSSSETEERETAIPLQGNITVIACVVDSLGSERRISKVIPLQEMVVTSNSVNETIYFFIGKSQESQTYSECFDQIMKASTLFSKVMRELSDKEVFEYMTLLNEAFLYCKTVDIFAVKSKQSVNQEVSILKDKSSNILSTDGGMVIDEETRSLQMMETVGELEVLVNLPTDLMDLSNIQMIGDVFSNSFGAMSNSSNGTTSTDEPTDDEIGIGMAASLMAMLNNVMMALGSHSVVGANATNMKTDNFEMSAQKLYPDALDDAEISAGNISISLTSDLTNSPDTNRRSTESTDDGEPMDIMVNVFSSPPVDTGQEISSPVFSLTVGTGQGGQKQVTNLSKPIIFTMPAALEDFEVETNPRLPGERPSCRYFNNETNLWEEDGCEIIEQTKTNITCACYHLTDFSSVVDHGEPTLNTLNAEDFGNITKLSVDNLTAVYFVVSLMLIYFLGVFILSLINLFRLQIKMLICSLEDSIDTGGELQGLKSLLLCFLKILVFRYKSDDIDGLLEDLNMKDMSEKEKDEKTSSWSKSFFLNYIFSNIWISILVEKEKKERGALSRHQILTIIHCLLLATSLSNALTFGQSQANFGQMIVASVASSLIVLPVTFLTILFRNVSHRIEDKEEEFTKIEEKIRYRIKKRSKKSRSVENVAFIAAEEGSLNRMSVWKLFNLLFYGIDETVHGLRNFLENSRFVGLISMFVLLLILVFYFIVIIFLNLASVYVMTWIGMYGCFLFSTLGIVALLYFIVVVFWFYLQKRYLNRLKQSVLRNNMEYYEEEASSNKMATWTSVRMRILHLILIILILALCLAINGVTIFWHISEEFPVHYNITIEVGTLLVMILLGYWIYKLFVPPSLNKKKEKKKKKKNKKKKNKKKKKKKEEEEISTDVKKARGLPHYFNHIFFCLSYIGIIVMSYLIILYGIKFDSDPNLESESVFGTVSGDWLFATFSSAGNNVVVNAPIKYIIKTVLIYVTTLIFSRIFVI